MAQRKTFNHLVAKRLRRDNMTYAAIAKKLGVSESAVYFAVNPGKRVLSEGQVTVFLPRPIREAIDERARNAEVSIARVIREILVGNDPPIRLEADGGR